MAQEETTIRVTGMSCGHCQHAVDALIREVDGVADATVSLEKAQAVVTFDTAKVSKQALIDVINDSEVYQAS